MAYSSPGQAQADTILQHRRVILRLEIILALGWTLAIVATAIASTLAAKRLQELHHVYAWVSVYVDIEDDTIDVYVADQQLLVERNKALLAQLARIWYP